MNVTISSHKTSQEADVDRLNQKKEKTVRDTDRAKSYLTKMKVYAPIDGIVNILPNTRTGGAFGSSMPPFKEGDRSWTGAAIAEIPDLTSLRLKGKTEEIDRGRMNEGQDVRVVMDPFPEKPFLGKLESISPLTEQTFDWPPSRNFRAYASLGAVDNRLRPAMNGRMDVIVDRLPDAISVPAKAVFARDGVPVVLVPGKDGLKPVKVEVVARNPDEVAVRGIDAGAQVALVDSASEEKKR